MGEILRVALKAQARAKSPPIRKRFVASDVSSERRRSHSPDASTLAPHFQRARLPPSPAPRSSSAHSARLGALSSSPFKDHHASENRGEKGNSSKKVTLIPPSRRLQWNSCLLPSSLSSLTQFSAAGKSGLFRRKRREYRVDGVSAIFPFLPPLLSGLSIHLPPRPHSPRASEGNTAGRVVFAASFPPLFCGILAKCPSSSASSAAAITLPPFTSRLLLGVTLS